MSTVAKQVVDLLNSSNLPKLHKAYSFAVGTSERTPRDSVDILVSEVNFDFTESGSNQYTEQIQRLAINVFYSKNTKVNMNEFEHSLMSFFVANGWQIVASFTGHTYDPNSGEPTISFQIKRREKWNFKV
ncbi:DUF806 family protein [Lactobacillus crispatus]|jgi:hypothetical protein|uniref:DUF806 family protein n=1 Tax=Lactobacillus crispatus TaxID=47770 RepID=A0A135ZFY6_9LACO|nr:DUF806 family protein [Lactobacillus crispatus]DAP43893.1 MAG TPA: tail completion protein [Caudoviricetes sp.]EEX28335.1 hypothetical protein HMPREF0508_02231 [Lactobacillus crispatus MV-3A-US]EFQ43499.1 hypothetical protein LBKG_02152 [Lactobacillus crispatus CTV-05]KWU09641.1 hypothetical protein AEL97_07950 [Lactobacillus crispatus]KXI20539.1 hypothetical protein HMPREF3209_00431 [Lactobacillus crispatus]